jgi:hypothetical protein
VVSEGLRELLQGTSTLVDKAATDISTPFIQVGP